MPTRDLNPLREGLKRDRIPDPASVVIFGASGDLTHRKLIPALYRLHTRRFLPPGTAILGVARRDWTDDDFRKHVRESVAKALGSEPPANGWGGFEALFQYIPGEFGDPAVFQRLEASITALEKARGGGEATNNRLFYLATPPDAFAPILEGLTAARLVQQRSGGKPWSRVIVEKPFGHDLDSARRLNDLVARAFREDQIYRIDHYLGKETVQNILVLRFGNGIFEPLWNRGHIDHVQITVAEDMGIEGRAGYFEQAGVIRDMIQNHMMQLVSLVAMEPPVAFEGEAVRDEKVKVIRSLRPIPKDQVDRLVVRGQYGPGSIGGWAVPGYREEPGVDPRSVVETYLALRLEIDNWRWAGVPFYLRSGKRLPRRATEVAIHFMSPPHRLFPHSGPEALVNNVLALRIQPDEGISIRFGAKVPGPDVWIQAVKMDFLYGSSFGVDPPEAYERLLLDCLLGDATLFIRRDEVEGAWAFVQNILDGWSRGTAETLPDYPAGSWGPDVAEEFIERDGREWRRL